MHNLTQASGVRGYNPVGLLKTPFDPASDRGGITGFIGPSGTESAPRPGIAYVVRGTDLILSVTGGKGVSVSLTDQDGGVLIESASSLAPLTVAVGWSICFGRFTEAPQVRAGAS